MNALILIHMAADLFDPVVKAYQLSLMMISIDEFENVHPWIIPWIMVPAQYSGFRYLDIPESSNCRKCRFN